MQLAYSHREVPVARGVDINTVTAERHFVVQLYEAAGSEISLELQLASSHTHQELVFAAYVDIHPVATAAERNFLVQPHEVPGSESSLKHVQAASTHQEIVAAGIDRIFVVQLHEAAGSESSLSAFQLASDTHQEVAGRIDINTVAAEESNFVVKLHDAAGSKSSLEAFQSASDTHQEVVAAGVDINTVAAEESNFVLELHEAAGSESSLEAFQLASATRQEFVVAAGVDIHTVAAAPERNFVVTQLHEASSEPKMRLMADLMNPAEEEAAVARTTRVLESLEKSLIHMNPEAASPHGHVDDPGEEKHEQQLLQAAALVNLINSPAAHRLTHESYHDTHELHHHDAHDVDTPVAPATPTGKKICLQVLGICI